jgi:hypothetical protein
MSLDWFTPFTLSTALAIRALECLFALSAGIQTLEYLRANIDYGFAEAHTVAGKIGVKVWICQGEGG